MKLPIVTVSETNQREHWGSRSRRRKAQREAAYLLTPKAEIPCTVKLTRLAPRSLDDDNLRSALKAIRDGIADRRGVDDADPRVIWEYAQSKGEPREYAVLVEISEA